MPSLRHEFLTRALPRMRRARELESLASERARIERWHEGLERGFPTYVVPFFERRFSMVREDLPAGFASYTMTRRQRPPNRTILYLHGGGFMAPIDPFQVRYAARLAAAIGARVVMPDYPLTPEHTWRESHEALVALAQRWAAASPGGLILAGDSAGGGLALAVTLAMRDRGGPQPSHVLLISPWVDLSESTAETEEASREDPWLFLGKMRAYAGWWAGSPADLTRPEVSPALGDLSGLPPALMFFGTRDTLLPGGRLLVRRGYEAGWDLTYVEQPGLLHVYPLMPIPEARRAIRQAVRFLL